MIVLLFMESDHFTFILVLKLKLLILYSSVESSPKERGDLAIFNSVYKIWFTALGYIYSRKLKYCNKFNLLVGIFTSKHLISYLSHPILNR